MVLGVSHFLSLVVMQGVCHVFRVTQTIARMKARPLQEGWNSNLSSTFKACRQLPMLLSYRCTSNQPPGPRFTVTLHRLGMRHSDTFKQNLIAHGLRIGVP